jgi:hypothetical protein
MGAGRIQLTAPAPSTGPQTEGDDTHWAVSPLADQRQEQPLLRAARVPKRFWCSDQQGLLFVQMLTLS